MTVVRIKWKAKHYQINHEYKGRSEKVFSTSTRVDANKAAARYLDCFEQIDGSHHYGLIDRKRLSLTEFIRHTE